MDCFKQHSNKMIDVAEHLFQKRMPYLVDGNGLTVEERLNNIELRRRKTELNRISKTFTRKY